MTKTYNVLSPGGDINMYGARPYLQQEFGLDRKEAGAILSEWMNSSN